jgi:hypothetical protein
MSETILANYIYRKKFRRAIYGPMIYTAPCIMLLVRANPLQGQVGGGPWNFFEPSEMALANQASAIQDPKKLRFSGLRGPYCHGP